ncbi:MAG: 2-isopropylmalate synthase [Candidatus Schekmanbacteria bacterium]|nr:MAG: 2-isopropylmalate synthase [Candidatus Schekmanbacteria bacterium]
MEYVRIFDTTLRDGEQAPGNSLNIKEKLIMARQLAKLKVDIIEAGFPVASKGDFEAVKEIAQKVKGPYIAGLARADKKDIKTAWEAVKYSSKPLIHTFIATSEIHMKYKLKMTKSEVLKRAVQAVKYAKSFTPDVEFSAEDASRSDLPFLAEVIEAAIDAGAVTVNIPDTVGYSMPEEFGSIIAYLKNNVPNIDRAVISVHCHNDLGLAVANSLAAVKNGARQVECTINGIGERAGNASLEEFVMGLYVRKDLLPFKTKIKTTELYKSSRLLSRLTGIFVPPNKAIVGDNAFAHEAGIHQHGVLKKKMTYEIMKPETVGVKESHLVLGKHSGRHALRKRYEKLGYDLTDEELEKAYNIFKELADRKKKIFDEDLEIIIDEQVRSYKEVFKLVGVQVLSGTRVTPVATVSVKKGKKLYVESLSGSGPVDAACRAIEKITNISGRLLDYSVRSVSAGKDAIGEIFVKVKFNNDSIFAGKSSSTDIIFASVKAYLNALNKYLSSEKGKKVLKGF